jgi:nitrate reductase NapD
MAPRSGSGSARGWPLAKRGDLEESIVNVSGVLVVVPAAETDAAVEALGALPGVEVHHAHPETGRVVVTLEAESVYDEVEGLRRIKALPGVVLAEMVYHYFEEDSGILANIAREDEDGRGAVPTVLDD